MKKTKLFSKPTQTQRDIANLLAAPNELQPDIFGSIEKVTLSRIQLDPMNPRKLGLNPESPELIDPKDPDRERKEAELEDLRLLAATIKEHGILEEPGVFRRGENYALVWGERRVLASRLLKHETITVKILPERPNDLREKQLIENMQRSDLSLSERVRGLRQAEQEHQGAGREAFNAAYLQRTLGLKKTMAYDYLTLCAAPDDVIDAIESGALNGVEQAATIARIKDEAERERAIARLLNPAEDFAAPSVANAVARPASRGRPATTISLGKTKSGSVARYIAEKVLEPKEFAPFQSANWDDLKVASDLLKQVIKKLEQRLIKT